MEVRPYQPADKTEVVALWQAAGLVVPWNDPYKDIERKLQVQPEGFLVALEDQHIVGSVMAGYDGHRGWINYLAVDPAFQGKGIGVRLVAEAEVYLRSLGCPKINLQVRASNERVIAFYEAVGFKRDEVLSMGKRLEPDD